MANKKVDEVAEAKINLAYAREMEKAMKQNNKNGSQVKKATERKVKRHK